MKFMEAQTEIIKAERQLLHAKITRDQNGLQLTVKGEIFEDHFKSLTGGNSKRILDEIGQKFYVPPEYPVQRLNGFSISAEAAHGLFHGENVNLAFLRVVGIRDGQTIRITNGVYSLDRLRDWMTKFRDGAKQYYLAVIKPVSIEVEITTREI